ncbi:MAG: ABC transporter permease subunit [Methyloprofundus sp.]|nr:ABC transporter permease subunit [Methyloprofundus sp.]
MGYFSQSLIAAINLLFQFDPNIYFIIWTSLKISLIATVIASLIAIPLGMVMAINQFFAKKFIQQLLNTLMAMPTVMIGLILYGLLSRKGIFGNYALLYTENAIILGEICLILPIIINMTLTAIQATDPRLLSTLKSLGASHSQSLLPLFKELKFVFLAIIITGFGRAIGEVGAAMMLGGNIHGSTRTLTTAIALETSKGAFEMGLALGIALLCIAFIVNVLLQKISPS